MEPDVRGGARLHRRAGRAIEHAPCDEAGGRQNDVFLASGIAGFHCEDLGYRETGARWPNTWMAQDHAPESSSQGVRNTTLPARDSSARTSGRPWADSESTGMSRAKS